MANNTYTARIQFLGLTEADTSTQAIAKALRELRAEISKTDPGTAKYKELTDQIGKLQSELNGLRQAQRDVTKGYEAQAKVPGSIAAIKAQTGQLISQFQNLSVGVNATQEEYDAVKIAIQASNDQIRLLTSDLVELKSISTETASEIAEGFTDSTVASSDYGDQIEQIKTRTESLRKENLELTNQLREQVLLTDQARTGWQQLAKSIASNSNEIEELQAKQKELASFEERSRQNEQKGRIAFAAANKIATNTVAAAIEKQRLYNESLNNLEIGSSFYEEVAKKAAEAAITVEQLRVRQKEVTDQFRSQNFQSGSLQQLKADLKDLKKRYEELGDNPQFEQSRKGLQKLIRDTQDRIRALNAEISNTPSFIERLTGSFKKAFKEIIFQAGAALGAIEGFRAIKDVGSEFLGIERGFAKVNTVAQLSSTELESLKASVLDLGRSATVELQTIPDALFTIQSATGNVSESQDVLGSSLKASKAGFSDLQSTAEAGVGIFGAVKNEVKSADEVFDVLFRTQKEGLLTFQDLSKEFPKVIPSAQALGAGFKEAAAAGATFTKFGFNANAAFTAVDATLKGLAKTTVQANLRQIGVEVFDAAGKTRPLVKIMEDLQAQLAGLTDQERLKKLGELGLDENAAKGLGSLTTNLEVYKQVSESIVDGSAGELGRQFDASKNTADDLQIAINNLKVTLFTELGPAFTAVAQSATGFLQILAPVLGFLLRNQAIIFGLVGAYAAYNAIKIKNTIVTALETKGTVLNTVATTANLLVTKTVTAAKVAYGVASQVLAGKITLATIAQRAFNVVASANPFGLLVAGAAALAGALLLLVDRTVKLTREQKIQKGLAQAVAEGYAREQAASAQLFLTLQSENSTREERTKAMQQINTQYGEYLPNLLTEKSSLDDIRKAQELVNKALLRKIQLEVQSASVTEELRKQAQALQEGTQLIQQQTGLTVAEINRAVDEVARNIKKASLEQVIAIGQSTKNFDLLAAAIAKTDGVSDAARKTIEKIRLSGASDDFLDLATVVGQTNREIDIINDYFNNLDPQGNFSDSITQTSGSFGNLTESVKELNEQLQTLREQQAGARTAAEWQEVGKQIAEVERRIKAITGDDKEAGKSLKRQAKEEKDRAKLIEDNEALLQKLRDDLAQARLNAIEDDTDRELAILREKYDQQINEAREAANAVLIAEVSTDANRAEAVKLRDETLLSLQETYEAKRIDIIAESQRRESERRKEVEQQTTDNRKAILDLELSTVQGQIELQEKGFDERKKLMQREMELQVRLLEAETITNLRSAESDEERTAIMANQLVQREQIIKDFANRLEEERQKQGSLLSRITGIDDEELKRIGDVLQQFSEQSLELLQQSLENQIKAIDKQAKTLQDKIAIIDEQIAAQKTRLETIEAELEEAQGQRRLRLIRLIEVERERENQLSADRQRNAQREIALSEERERIERRQAALRKAQAIAQAVANTALGITRVIAEVPKADFGVSTAVLIGLYTALGAAQVATIAAQEFADGGKLSGPKHSDPERGIPIKVPGQPMVLAEGEEFIVNRRSTATNEDVLRTINADRGRTRFIALPVSGHGATSGLGLAQRPSYYQGMQLFEGGGKLADRAAIASTARLAAESLASTKKIDELIAAVKAIPAPVLVANDVSDQQRITRRARNRVTVE